MSNVFKLDDIRAAAKEAFANFPVDLHDDLPEVILRNVLQLTEAERKAISTKPDEDSESDGGEQPSTLDKLREQVRAVADTAEGAERLIKAVGDDLATMVTLIKQYNEATQVGEA